MINNPLLNQQALFQITIDVAKRSISLLGASAMALGLLFIMTQLISNEMPALEEESHFVIPTFVPDEVEADVEVIQVKPVMPKATPDVPRDSFIKLTGIDKNINPVYHSPQSGELPTPTTIGLPGGMALVPIAPRFPDRAAQMGICGHVILQYDIAPDGIPINIAILESSHRVFNKNAIQAIERARFKPDTQGGKPVAMRGKQEKITFQLEEGC